MLQALLEDAPNPISAAAQAFERATVDTFRALLTAPAHRQSETLAALLARGIDPHTFQRHEAWLGFWTAVSAITGYARENLDSASALDPKADWWCAQWEVQIKEWGVNAAYAGA